ncbi:MAG: TRL domain-containing protein [Bacteroidales bacterium]|nr:TRL domain-containing protein [Bacteroidales bacterium]
MKKIYFIISIALVFAFTACTVSGPLLVTDNTITKRGESSYKVILGFPPFKGDRSIQTAARNGGITKIATVDVRVRGGLFVQTYTTVVTGE